ncbi:MAG TPA: DUF2953 domain-containing protein [Syntrophomonadaceae bacterium]|nr:DUF2953 domain-containing protein [Syntrophomonadaceae bacterium]
MICLTILLILLLIVIILFWGFFNISFSLSIEAVDNQLEVELVFLFLFKKSRTKYSINKENLFSVWDFTKDDLANRNRLDNFKKDFLDFISRSEDLQAIINYLQYANLRELEWKSYIGLDDAARTGFFTGVLWAFKGICLSLLRKDRAFSFQINIYPNFTNTNLSSQLTCILRIRIVHIILIGIAYLFAKVRGEYYGLGSKATI